jgi:ribosomal protein S18 acetylase RimI-like enzyme
MINTSTDVEKSRVIDSLVLGFSADPVLRWLFPEPQKYLAISPTIIQLYGGGAFAHSSAYHLQNYAGAALWLPPDAHPDEEGLTKLFQDNFDGAQLEEIFSLFEQMDNFHPDKSCWHLAFIAVDPVQQNRGLGSSLMKYALEVVDRDKKLAYLESTNEANLTLYRRHGFELVGNIQAGNSPSLFPMIREPR